MSKPPSPSMDPNQWVVIRVEISICREPLLGSQHWSGMQIFSALPASDIDLDELAECFRAAGALGHMRAPNAAGEPCRIRLREWVPDDPSSPTPEMLSALSARLLGALAARPEWLIGPLHAQAGESLETFVAALRSHIERRAIALEVGAAALPSPHPGGRL